MFVVDHPQVVVPSVFRVVLPADRPLRCSSRRRRPRAGVCPPSARHLLQRDRWYIAKKARAWRLEYRRRNLERFNALLASIGSGPSNLARRCPDGLV